MNTRRHGDKPKTSAKYTIRLARRAKSATRWSGK